MLTSSQPLVLRGRMREEAPISESHLTRVICAVGQAQHSFAS